MSILKNVIFDLDGTLVDSLEGITSSILYAARKNGHLIDENIDIKTLIGPPMRDLFLKLLSHPSDTVIEQVLDNYREDYAKRGLLKTVTYNGIASLLSALKEKGYAIYIATSKRQVFAEEIVKNNNLSEYFVGIYGTTTDGRLDNKEVLLKHLMLDQKLNSRDVVFIGDRKEDVIAAIANNVPVIGAKWGYADGNELEYAGAHYLCESPHELLETISVALTEHQNAAHLSALRAP